QEKEIAPFMVFHDSSLKEMASYFPRNKDSFLMIKGVGQKKYESYGEEFIAVIDEYAESQEIESKAINKTEIIRDDLVDRYEESYNCYVQGLSLKEISEKRN